MHSGFEIPGINHHHRQQQADENNINSARGLLSMNQLEQIHAQPAATQQLFLDQQYHNYFPVHQQSRLNHGTYGAAASSLGFKPQVNFKLGLSNNEINCTRNNNNICSSTSVSSSINEDAISYHEQLYHHQVVVVPEAARQYTTSSLGMLTHWQNQPTQDSPIKQPPPFWEPLPSEVSNENSEIVDMRSQDQPLEMNKNEEALTNCLDSKSSRVHFGELEAIYKRLGTAFDTSNQTHPIDEPVVNRNAYNSNGEEVMKTATKKRKKKKKKKKGTSYNQMIHPMAEFIENLVKQVIDHQESLHQKFTEVIERLDLERREREDAWRNLELANFEKKASEREHERFLAENREATIVSYLEKITGQKMINFPKLRLSESNASVSDDHFDNLGRDGATKSRC